MTRTPSSFLCLAALFSSQSLVQVNAVPSARLGSSSHITSESHTQPNSDTAQTTDHRNLQFGNPVDVVLKSLVDSFMPALADELQGSITDPLDPIDLNYETSADVGAVQLANMNQTFCGSTNATAIIVYQLGDMTGLGNMNIERLELIQGSQDIDIPLLGWFGAEKATWSGIWEMEATFDQFQADTTGIMQTTFCNVTFANDQLTGLATVTQPRVVMQAYLEGSTDNIYEFNDSTELTVVDIRSLTGSFTSVSADLGSFGNMAVVDADEPMIEIGTEGFAPNGDITKYVQEEMQTAVNNGLPLRL